MIRYEIRKIFSKKGSKVGLIVLVLSLVISCYFAVTSVEYVDENGETQVGMTAVKNLRAMKMEWKGYVTEEVLRAVIRENNRVNQDAPEDPNDIKASNINYARKQGYSDLRELINHGFCEFREYNYYRADSVTEDEVGKLYDNRILELEKWLLSDEAKERYSEKEKEFLIHRYEQLKTPLYYEYAKGWNAAIEFSATIIMLTVLITSFFVSGIFSNEFQWKADSIFFSTKHGRNKGTMSKVAAGFTIITMIYWMMVLLYSGVVLGMLGTDGAGCMIQTGLGFWKSFYNITYLQAYLLILIGGYVGNLFILLVCMLVSAKTHTTVLSVTIPFILLFVEPLLSGFAVSGFPALADILGLLPDQLLQIYMAIRTFSVYEIGGKVIGAVPILLTVYPVLCVILLPVMYRVYKRTEIK